MVAMNRVRVAWTGGAGGNGVSTFYFGSTTTDMTALKALFNSLKTYVPTGITWTVPVLGDQINDTDGLITGSWVGTNGGTVASLGGTSSYSGTSGFCIDWLSSAIIAGRRRQGRTFFVPAAQLVYQNNGSIDDPTLTAIQSAATTMITAYAGEFKVWSRPYPGRAQIGTPGNPGYKPAKPARVGAAVQVIAARVPDLAIVLRSRRK